jgi:ABC-type transport system substrate-binding protein
MMRVFLCFLACFIVSLQAEVSAGETILNDPYPCFEINHNTLYTSFTEPPKHLDPARSYSVDESVFVQQIYEPPYQYHYLKRPYEIVPLTATAVEAPVLLDKNNQRLDSKASHSEVAYSVYRIEIKPNIFYQMHPAFDSRNIQGNFFFKISDFKNVSTRELVANDYLYGIKRLADPEVESPIYGFMSRYIVGFSQFHDALKNAKNTEKKQKAWFNLNHLPLEGAREIDRYTFEIKINGQYPQFKYWLAMPFFSPIPWEADLFYSQPGMAERNLTLDTEPVGTGPYYLSVNNPNLKMILEKNKNFNHEVYPNNGLTIGDDARLSGYFGEKIPFIDKIVFNLEKESIPYWNKFEQGYYDFSGIMSDNFDQAIKMGASGAELTPEMKQKGIVLKKSMDASVFYWGFNMLDDTVGGYAEKNRNLRHAISAVFDVEEYIDIFLNGRAEVARSVIPPEVFNNPFKNTKNQKTSIQDAQILLSKAGYPGGINPKTKKPLILHFESIAKSNGDDAAFFDWLVKQFSKLNIELDIRNNQYNEFQDKIQKGRAQIFFFGWKADYPDPENFLFLFLTAQGKVKFSGENATNYSNTQFDSLFLKLNNITSEDQKRHVINQMDEILDRDMPWMGAFYPLLYRLEHSWNGASKPGAVINNTMKYLKVDPRLRRENQIRWNQPLILPAFILIGMLIAIISALFFAYRLKMHHPRRKIDLE